MLMDQVDDLHDGRYWSEVYAVPSWSTLCDLEVKVTDFENFMLKFFIKDLRSLYLLNMLMDQVDTLHV